MEWSVIRIQKRTLSRRCETPAAFLLGEDVHVVAVFDVMLLRSLPFVEPLPIRADEADGVVLQMEALSVLVHCSLEQ